MDIVKLLISKKVNVDAEDETGKTLLGWAISYNVEAIPYLIEQGADPFFINPKYWSMSPFERAIKEPIAIQKLLNSVFLRAQSKSQNINGIVNDGKARTLFHYAAGYGDRTLAEQMIQAGADINAQDLSSETPLYIAYKSKNDAVTKLLLEQKNINLSTPSLIYLAINNGDWKFINYLIKNGIDIKARMKYIGTPLNYALKCGKTGIAKLFLKEYIKEFFGRDSWIDNAMDVQDKRLDSLLQLGSDADIQASLQNFKQLLKENTAKLANTISNSGNPSQIISSIIKPLKDLDEAKKAKLPINIDKLEQRLNGWLVSKVISSKSNKIARNVLIVMATVSIIITLATIFAVLGNATLMSAIGSLDNKARANGVAGLFKALVGFINKNKSTKALNITGMLLADTALIAGARSQQVEMNDKAFSNLNVFIDEISHALRARDDVFSRGYWF